MRILFDQGTPVPLCAALASHEVVTAFEAGWARLKNGDLLQTAETEFDVFITTDKNLQYQQNLANRRLAILVLPTTNWLEIRNHTAEVAATVQAMKPGDYRELRWA
ncbi:MAG: DUF5615 family PIN-like protein [Verrucomicrobia bacterium]|nr:DUF5615 family PIN-like protein [Verrucomicrobiota bacterium]